MSNGVPLLCVRNLQTRFYLRNRTVHALNGVNLDIYAGRITALIGGSGSGKSVLALSILDLVERPGLITGGEILFENINLLELSEKDMRRIRGKKISMIFQEPANSMNPVIKVKNHLSEVLRYGGIKLTGNETRGLFLEALNRVGLRDGAKILEQYPFELSGGMCQRVMVAMGLLANSKILIADEPTSSLDLTTQAAILRELYHLRNEGLAIILITHDLGVVAQTADDVYVIKDGFIVESGTVFEVFENPQHEYTKSLFAGNLYKDDSK
jgi:ABC-type dipeptide/oligopeptide/nickel transport system ATPase component